MREIVHRVMKTQMATAKAKGIHLHAEFLNILDSEEEAKDQGGDQIGQDDLYSPMVVTDAHRVMQVLLCLQSNALKFTKKGFVKIAVSIVELQRRGKLQRHLRINVRDTGVGIPEEDHNKLFKLFGFIENKNSILNSKGVGLGLVISQKICKQFEGRLYLCAAIPEP